MTTADAYELHTQLIQNRNKNLTIDRVIHIKQYEKIFPKQTLKWEDAHWFDQLLFSLDKEILNSADTIVVSKNVQELIETAKATMPDEVLFVSDVYTPAGLIVLEKPLDYWMEDEAFDDGTIQAVERTMLRLQKSHGCSITGERKFQKNASGGYTERKHCSVVALAFGNFETFAPSAISNFARTFTKLGKDQLEEFSSFSQRDMPNNLQVRVYGHFLESQIDGLTAKSTALSLNPLLIDSLEIGYGENSQVEGRLSHTGENVKNYSNNRRFVITLLRLLSDYIDADPFKVPRAHHRRGASVGRKKSDITLLNLRRSIYGDTCISSGDKRIILAHLVRGHWRNQWYPSQQQHRAKWINAHRRGGNQTDEIIQKHRIIAVTK